MTTDVLVTQNISGYYDLSLNDDGDLANGDFFDSSIIYSIFGERRASASEVAIAERRRGWIGNVGKDFENGSKIWLYFQARLTRDVMNGIKTEALKSLQWLVDDDSGMAALFHDRYATHNGPQSPVSGQAYRNSIGLGRCCIGQCGTRPDR